MNANEFGLRQFLSDNGYGEPSFFWPRVTKNAGRLACDVYFLDDNVRIKFVKYPDGWRETSRRVMTARQRRDVADFLLMRRRRSA